MCHIINYNIFKQYIKRKIPILIYFEDISDIKNQEVLKIMSEMRKTYPMVFCYQTNWLNKGLWDNKKLDVMNSDVLCYKKSSIIEKVSAFSTIKLHNLFQTIFNDYLINYFPYFKKMLMAKNLVNYFTTYQLFEIQTPCYPILPPGKSYDTVKLPPYVKRPNKNISDLSHTLKYNKISNNMPSENIELKNIQNINSSHKELNENRPSVIFKNPFYVPNSEFNDFENTRNSPSNFYRYNYDIKRTQLLKSSKISKYNTSLMGSDNIYNHKINNNFNDELNNFNDYFSQPPNLNYSGNENATYRNIKSTLKIAYDKKNQIFENMNSDHIPQNHYRNLLNSDLNDDILSVSNNEYTLNNKEKFNHINDTTLPSIQLERNNIENKTLKYLKANTKLKTSFQKYDKIFSPKSIVKDKYIHHRCKITKKILRKYINSKNRRIKKSEKSFK